ncbi:MAG: thiamine-phosphate kinase [Microbacteriaceae bacterium]|nr:thiamine-phosphate kinase [Microbacteriaceae bacterium]
MTAPDASARPAPRTVADAGEREVLAEVLARIPIGEAELGPGDDAAVLAAADGRFVVTTDTMIEGPDFRRAWSSPVELGRKAIASNLADVVAMGARPTGLVVALAVPRDTEVAWVAGLADGFASGLAELWPGCGVIGGDLATAPVAMLAVTAFGSLDGRAPVTRAGARPGDVVAVAGPLGRAAGGLRLLFARAVDGAGAPDAAALAALRAEGGLAAELVDQQLAPAPPLRAGVAAAEAGATAMMDMSDGLLLDADRLTIASDVAIELDTALVDDDVRALSAEFDRETALRLVLGGGEDHSLLACFGADAALPAPFRPIGRVVESGEHRVLVDGVPADPAGWDPYAGLG